MEVAIEVACWFMAPSIVLAPVFVVGVHTPMMLTVELRGVNLCGFPGARR
jgi:hypothetical protein